jgi:membrane protein YqaA with SNARE-associated domain
MANRNGVVNNVKKRTTKEKFRIYHKINIRSGLYKFLGQNFVKLVLFFVAIIIGIFLLDLIFDLKHIQELMQRFVDTLRPIYVFSLSLLTESFLGLIPPDVYIVWAKAKFPEHPYLIVTVLATLSYIGGIIAYFLGRLIRKFPSIRRYVEKKYEKNFNLIDKWGSLIIIMAALFPLPFAAICTIVGIVRFPFRQFLLYGLFRYIRFYVHALVLFGALKEYI